MQFSCLLLAEEYKWCLCIDENGGSRAEACRAVALERLFFPSNLSFHLLAGKLIICNVTGIAHRRPQGESYDQAIRNDETGLWQCPFCQQDNFPELSEVMNLCQMLPL